MNLNYLFEKTRGTLKTCYSKFQTCLCFEQASVVPAGAGYLAFQLKMLAESPSKTFLEIPFQNESKNSY